MSWSSEALKCGILPSKSVSEMTEQDWFEFRNSLDPDIMGFDGIEGFPFEEMDIPEEPISCLSGSSNFTINDNLTTRNFTDGKGVSRIKYIVVHYTANNGDTAWANTTYFKSTYRGASAHYFVDENATIWRCVKDEDISWHCGGGLQGSKGHTYHKICTNSNSIGIEMCSRKYSNGTYYFKEQTIMNCELLVKYLMDKYNVPAKNVIRHFDVTGKICPAPFVNDSAAWNNFKSTLDKPFEQKIGIYKVVDCTELNVRTGNSTAYNKIGTLKENTKVEVTELNNGWGKIEYSGQPAWVSLAYLEFVSEIKKHWAETYLNSLIEKNCITDKSQWDDFENPIPKCLTVALIDKMTGGTWASNQADKTIHWAQPSVISLTGKKVITDTIQWVASLDVNISKALLLALVCNITGGISDLYKNRTPDHWARNCLDTLCDRGIVNTPSSWTDFESEVNKGQTMALLCKAIYR